MRAPDVPTRRGSRKLTLAEMPALVAEHDAAVSDSAAATTAAAPLRALPVAAPSGEVTVELVAEVLNPVLDEFVDGVLGTVEDMRAGDAAPLDGAFEHNLRAAIAAALRQFTRVVEDGDVSTLDLSLFRELGRKHALVGYPLEDLLWLYRVGAIACWRQATTLYSEGRFTDEVLARVGELVFTLSHTLAEAAVAGYSSEAASTSTLAQARRYEFLRRLLTGSEPPTDEEFADAAAEFGWALPDKIVVAVAVVDPDARGARHSFGTDALVEGSVREHHVALLPAPAQPEDAAAPGTPPPVGMDRVVLGPAVPVLEARTSYHQALRLLELADRGLVPGRPVLRAADHWLALMLDREPHLVGDVVERRLGGLLELSERRRGPMLETLTAWLARPGQISAIADELHVHAQTVRYRLERLRELVGPAIDDPEARLELSLATYAFRRRYPDVTG